MDFSVSTLIDLAYSGTMETKTEALLRQAKAICQEVTGREDVSDDLLCAVFRRLELEADLAEGEIEDAMDDARYGPVH